MVSTAIFTVLIDWILTGTGPATNDDILARSYSGKAPQPPAPRKKSADSTTPVKIGFRHASDSSEGSFSDVPWTGTPDSSRLDSLPSEAPPPPPPRSTPSSSVGSATATIAAAAATATVRDADEDDLEVIYEEKGLGKAFRQFLATRKEDVWIVQQHRGSTLSQKNWITRPQCLGVWWFSWLSFVPFLAVCRITPGRWWLHDMHVHTHIATFLPVSAVHRKKVEIQRGNTLA